MMQVRTIKQHASFLRYPSVCRTFKSASTLSFFGASQQESSSGKLRRYGQPSPSTHPHLLYPDQITPGIPASEYAERRNQILQKARLRENDMILLFSGPTKYMTHNIFYRFRSNTNFWYLTGFEEPDSVAAIYYTNGKPSMTMFCRPQTEENELWDGYLSGPDGAMDMFRADEAYPIADLSRWLKGKISKRNMALYLDFEASAGVPDTKIRHAELFKTLAANEDLTEVINIIQNDVPSYQVRNIRPFLEQQRAIKSINELNVMKRASLITAYAHAQLMLNGSTSEHQLEASFNYHCSKYGSVRQAYVPVIAGGDSALSLHYTENNRLINQDRLVLVDAGCEWGGYASDLSRTFPVGRRMFSDAERDLISVVNESKEDCIKACEPGVSRNDLHNIASDTLSRGLKQLGWNVSQETLRHLFPHGVSHYVGVDLHDSRSLGYAARLEKGMVITIEPGIYVRPGLKAPKHFENIGIRIEDMVALTQNGCENLSDFAPGSAEQIEAIIQKGKVDPPAELDDFRIPSFS